MAFNATGLKDIVADRKTGYLADPFSSESLAKGICWVLDNKERIKFYHIIPEKGQLNFGPMKLFQKNIRTLFRNNRK